MNDKWTLVKDELPPDGEVVETKIDDGDGKARNVQTLKRRGRLWYYPDDSMYVYYTPTHWKPDASGADGAEREGE